MAKQHRPQRGATPLRLLNPPCQPKIPPYHLDAHRTVRPARGIDRQTTEPRVACLGTQRQGACGLFQTRVLHGWWMSAADGAAGRPWPTDAGAWRCVQVTAAVVKTAQGQQAQPAGDRSLPWWPEGGGLSARDRQHCWGVL